MEPVTSTSDVQPYAEFRLDLRPLEPEERFVLRVTESPAGEMTSRFNLRLPFEEWEVDQALASISRATKEWVQRSGGPKDVLDPIKEIGSQLFESLFEGPAGSLYQQSLSRIEKQGRRLRVRLLTVGRELSILPWEFLYDRSRQDFIALTSHASIVRSLGSEQRLEPLAEIEPPLRVLVVAAGVVPAIDSQRELDELEKLAASRPEMLAVESVVRATPESLLQALRSNSFHVFHFIGTGGYTASDPDSQALALLAPGSEKPYWMSPRRLLAALDSQPELRLVYLNGCRTDRFAEQLCARVPAVIGMRGELLDETCQSFTRGLYRDLLAGQPLEAAVTGARQTVDLEHPGGREWGLPVFYLQAAEGMMLAPRTEAASFSVEATSERRRESRASVLEGLDVPARPQRLSPELERQWKYFQKLLDVEVRNLDAIDKKKRHLGAHAQILLEGQEQAAMKKVSELKVKLKDLLI